MITDTQITIGEIVTGDYRTAAVFSRFGIDFFCNGYKTLGEVCKKRKLQARELIKQLNDIKSTTVRNKKNYASWPIEKLVDYIEQKHHSYIEEKTPIIRQFLTEICKSCGDRYPEIHKINELFMLTAGDLAAHMRKEELILFPFIRQMIKSKKDGNILPAPYFGSVTNLTDILKADHFAEGERFETIAKITNGYAAPADADNRLKMAYAMLHDFEMNLHTHIHLENNILFPRITDLEREFEA